MLLTPKDGQSYTGFGGIKFYDAEVAIATLKEDLNDEDASPDKMFSRAMSYSNDDDKTRVPDFNAQYAFSRAMFITSIILSILWIIKHYAIWWMWLLAVFAIALSWIRFRERGFYYAREVLAVYIKKKGAVKE